MASNFITDMKTTDRFSDVWLEPLRILPLIQGYEQIPIVSLEDAIQPIKSFIPEIGRMLWIVKQHCEQTEDELTFNESASILIYTMEWTPREESFYYLFNQILRSEHRDLTKPWLLYFKLLLTAFFKLPNKSNTIVYRGTHMDLSTKYIQGSTCIWWGFSSCTMSVEYICNFRNEKGPKTLFEIECQTGKDIRQHTFSPEQQEILFLPARQFQIIENYHDDDDLCIINLKEIQPHMSFLQPRSSVHTIATRTRSRSEHLNTNLEHLIDRLKSHGEIKLVNLKLTDHDMEIVIKQAINNKNCAELLLNNNQITYRGASILASILSNNTTLKKLVIANNDIGDLGAKCLSQILATNHTHLNILDLSSNDITCQGIEHLSEMLNTNTSLRSLWLNDNKIHDQGVHSLMQSLASKNTTLKFLRLSSNQTIGDGSIDAMVLMLEQNTTLKYLDIQHCSISWNGQILLEKAIRLKKHFYLHI